MRMPKTLLAMVSLFGMTAIAHTEPVVFKDDVIEITFPGPFTTQKDELTLPTGKVIVTTRSCKFGTLLYSVVTSDLPPNAPVSLEGGADNVIKQTAGTLKSFEKFKRGEISGCEYVVDTLRPIGTTRRVMLVIGSRYYSLVFTGPIASEKSKAADRFFYSLKLFGEGVSN